MSASPERPCDPQSIATEPALPQSAHAPLPEWAAELTHKDWLFDGCPIRGEYLLQQWALLDWSKAYVDMGPSLVGNPGPYWHVPHSNGDTVHRLYPKLLTTKWLGLVQRAITESVDRALLRESLAVTTTVRGIRAGIVAAMNRAMQRNGK